MRLLFLHHSAARENALFCFWCIVFAVEGRFYVSIAGVFVFAGDARSRQKVHTHKVKLSLCSAGAKNKSRRECYLGIMRAAKKQVSFFTEAAAIR